MSEPKFPQVNVKMVGEDGNAFSILARVSGAMRKAGIDKGEIDQFTSEAMSGDYDHLLRTVMATVSVDNEEDVDVYDDDEDFEDDDYCPDCDELWEDCWCELD